jgi:hypothetical protein
LTSLQRLCQLIKSSDEVVNAVLDRAHEYGMEKETLMQLLYNLRVFRYWGNVVCYSNPPLDYVEYSINNIGPTPLQ